jgi:hypothetical protein
MRQKTFHQTSFQEIKLGMKVYASYPGYTGSTNRRIIVQANHAKSKTLYPKYPEQKGLEAVAQVREGLPRKCEALN